MKYNAMLDWWLENGPPVYISAAAYLGLGGKGSTTGTKEIGNLNDLAAMAGPGGMIQ